MVASVEDNRTLAESDSDDRLAAEGLKQLGYQPELARVSTASFHQFTAPFLMQHSRLEGFFTFYSVCRLSASFSSSGSFRVLSSDTG